MSLQKTSGIVFRTTPYGNTSLVAKIYTQKFGLQSYLVNNVRSSRAKNKNNYFQPLSLINLVAYHKPTEGLKRISEISFSHPLEGIHQNMMKVTQALFITEVLYKSIKEEEANADLFDFIQTSVLLFDSEQENTTNFHLLFLIKLSAYLGFKPMGTFSNHHCYFNLSEGIFQSIMPLHQNFITGSVAEIFSLLNITSYAELKNVTINKLLRNELMDALLLFYNLHLDGGINVQSHHILKEVLTT